MPTTAVLAAASALLIAVLPQARAADGPLIHSLDDIKLRLPNEKAPRVSADFVEGKVGRGMRLAFTDKCSGAFAMTPIKGAPEWDRAAGFSFWVKGDGSAALGGLQFIWNDDFGKRYDLAFPLDSKEWRKITVAWSDLTPVLPGTALLDAKNGPAPSKLSALWFGKWWYWRDYAAHGYVIDELRLETDIPAPADHTPKDGPLARVAAKLKAGQPVTVVTMGDSLTDTAHWANKPVHWPGEFAKIVAERFAGSKVTVENPAIGGTQMRQGVVLIPRWAAKVPAPDLVVICYGYNDWDAGMRGAEFRTTAALAVDRVRRATEGKADVLLMTNAPAVERWTTMAELAAAVRGAAADRKAGLADLEKAFHEAGKSDPASLFCRDKVHLSPAGHKVIASTVADVLTAAVKELK